MEAEFLEKKQIIQNQAEKLKTEEQLAETKARSNIFAAIKGDNLLRGGLMSLKEDEQHQAPVTDDKSNRRNQHVKHSSRKY